MSVNMSEFFNYMRGLEGKWDAKFQMQAELNDAMNKKLQEETARKIKEMEATIELNRLVREYDSSVQINKHISHTNDKIALSSGGVALVGAVIAPIPIIGLVGVGIVIASSVTGIVHLSINSQGKIKDSYEIRLGRLIKNNPGCNLEQAKDAMEWLRIWFQTNPYKQFSDPDFEKSYAEIYRQSIPRYYNYMNLQPLLD